MPRAFTPSEKAAIRSALFERGRGLFARHGLRQTSIQQLTRAVGIAQGSFYAFYPSKEDLFFEILEEEERELGRGLVARLESGDLGRERLMGILRAGIEAYQANPFLGGLLRSREYEHLRRSIPEERMRRHVEIEERLATELLRRLRPGAPSSQIDAKRSVAVLQAIFLLQVHEDEFDPAVLRWLMEHLYELAVDTGLHPHTPPFGQNAR
jgi:AcrR family transcriptional regulator